MSVSYDTSGSMSLYQEAAKIMPGGVSGDVKYRTPYPLFLKRASGSHIVDVDENEYIDYALSFGALILGHGHKVVSEAMSETISGAGTTLFGYPSEDEIEFGKLLLDKYMKRGKVRFTNSGLEATLLATRLGMAVTGKRKIAKFDGHYHGANPFTLVNHKSAKIFRDQNERVTREADSAEISGGLFSDSVVLPFNDIDGTRKELENSDVAAVIMEPFEDGYIPANQDFMRFLRDYTRDKGIVLIFDEVKTGFRIRLGGATEFYGIEPDLTCLGKIIGGGTPVGAVVGKSDIMDLLDPKTETKKVFHSGTFNGNPLSMRVGLATITELKRNGNFDRILQLNSSLKRVFSESLDELGIEHTLYGEGGIVNFIVGKEKIRTQRDIPAAAHDFRKIVDAELLRTGLYSVPDSRFSLCLAHNEADIERTRTLFKGALQKAIEEMQLYQKGESIRP